MNPDETRRENDIRPIDIEMDTAKGEKIMDFEIEACSDTALIKRVKLTAKAEGIIEIVAKDKSSVSFALQDFVGAEVYQHPKVAFCEWQAAVSVLAIYYAVIKKGNVKFQEYLCYSKDISQLTDFKQHSVGLYYTLVGNQPFHTKPGARKRYLFFVSPASGKGTAIKFYDQHKKYFE
jgi:hypothetical protein